VRAIGNDLHMDYSAVGPTTHLAARMEQLATPGSIMLAAPTLRLVEALVRVNALGPNPVQGPAEPVEGFEPLGATPLAPRVAALRERVTMQLDPEVDQAYPQRWIGKVTVTTRDGRSLSARVDEPKGDPGNTLTRAEIEDKAQRLAAYGKGATPAEVQALIARVWAVAEAPRMDRWLEARA